MSLFNINKEEIPKNGPNDEKDSSKKEHKWLTRVIAVTVVVTMIVSTINNNSTNLGNLEEASFSQDGDNVLINDDVIKNNVKTIENADSIRDNLKKDYEKVVSLIEDEKYEKAIEPAEELYSYLSDDEKVGPYLRSILSELYFMTTNYKKCAKICDEMIKNEENLDGSVYFMNGISKMQTSNYEEAVENLKEALNTGYSDQVMCKAQLALACMNLGNQDEAIGYAQEVLASEHDASLDESLNYIMAVSYLQKGEYQEGIDKLNDLILSTENGEYYYFRGVGEMALEEYDNAISDFAAALDKGYDETACYYNYGVCLYAIGDTDNAKKALNTVIERKDDKEYTDSAKDLLDSLS